MQKHKRGVQRFFPFATVLLCICLKKMVLLACMQIHINLKELIRLPSPRQIYLTVRPSGIGGTLILNLGIKIGYPRGVICLASDSSEYLFLCARRKFRFNKNLYKITYCLRVLPTKFLHYYPWAWAKGTFLRQQKKFLKPTRSECQNDQFSNLKFYLSHK